MNHMDAMLNELGRMRNLKKRTCTFLLAVLLLLSLVPAALAANGGDGLQLAPSRQEDAIVVRASLVGCAGVTNGRLAVTYDPEVVTFERATPADGGCISSVNAEAEDSVSFAWIASNLPEDEAAVVDLVFSVNDPSREATATFEGIVSEIYQSGTPVTLSADAAQAETKIVCGDAVEVPFTDIDGWAKAYIEKAYRAGLVKGVTNTTFAPNAKMTRGMFVTVLYRMAKEPAVEGTSPFADVSAEQYYFDAVCWAYSEGVVKGVSKTAFSPNGMITRQEMVTMLYRYAMKNGTASGQRGDLSNFPDATSVAGWAKEAMAWAVAQGIVIGSDGALQPTRDSTRAEAVTVVCRFAGL